MANEEYTDFVHTGPGTLAGRYMRMFWQPVYRGQELAKGRAVPIRIMSEDFTLYRGEGGTPYVVAFRCAHRGTQLSTGWVEGDCIRCRYHGWKYDATGKCVEQPGEEESFASKVKIQNYPTKEYLGIIFAYIGEGEPPPLKRFPEFEEGGVIEVNTTEVWPCNYFNRLDNASDPVHVPFVHRESRLTMKRPQDLEIPKILSVDETEYGIRSSSASPGRPARESHFHMPNINQIKAPLRIEIPQVDMANAWIDRLFWRVPIDDEHCMSFIVDHVPLEGEAARLYQERRRQMRLTPVDSSAQLAEEVLTGKARMEEVKERTNIYNITFVEDYITQVGQGPIPDHTTERLSSSDVGVVFLRKIWERELRTLAAACPLKQWATSSRVR